MIGPQHFPSTGRFCVLDIETAPAVEALAVGDARGGDPGGRVALHSLVALSLILFERTADGRFEGLRLVSLDADDGEADLLVRLDDEMAPVHDTGGGLITFAGLSHDVPVLERRAARHWLFDRLRYAAWRGHGAARHLDLMRSGPGTTDGLGSRLPSLLDSCAAYGIDASTTRQPGDPVAAAVRKSQVDTIATFLLHLYAVSAIERSATPVAEGWTALARFLASPRVRAEHLLPFARHPHVAVARRLLSGLRA